MILLVCIALVMASVPLTGGRLSALADLQLRGVSLVFAALAVQTLIINVVPGAAPAAVLALVHLASYVPAVAFLYLNRQVRGLWLMGAGGLANLTAIAANGGVMPASPAALASAGMSAEADQFVNSGAVDGARLAWLGDIMAVPASWPLSNVFSIGDIALVVGLAILLHRRCHGKRSGETATEPERPLAASP